MARPSKQPVHPREMVLKILRRRKSPMSAYAVLEKLSEHGIKGPPVVYRALDALMERGLVHKIQATSEYIACNCTADHDHGLSVLTICGGCKKVAEIHDHAVIHHLEKLSKLGLVLADHAVVELPVMCGRCTPN